MSNAESKKKVLIVEDESALSEALSDKLRNMGLEVSVGADGEEGLLLAKQMRPDIMLVDVLMPKMDGFSLFNAVKDDDDLKNIPFVFLTNLSEDLEIMKLSELENVDYIVKADWKLKDIIKLIEQKIAIN